MNKATDMGARMIRASRAFAREAGGLAFGPPVSLAYNPLEYARAPHEEYLRGFATGPTRVVFLGMNPGPWGMAQTGVPFGDVPSVRDWLGISGAVRQPRVIHEKHPVQGFDCARREVSGTRFWGLMRERYGTAEAFAAEAFVANYCPLMFLDDAGRNLTPDRLAAGDRRRLEELCDRFLLTVVTLLQPQWVVGIGGFAERRARAVLAAATGDRSAEHGSPGCAAPGPRVGLMPHPSPASPQANRGWADLARRALVEQGIWVPPHSP